MPYTEHNALIDAIEIARLSPCAKSKRGAVIFTHEGFISSGFNSPPPPFVCQGKEGCGDNCRILAVHAEQRALASIIFRGIPSVQILHVAVNDRGEIVEKLTPQCLQCSKLMLEAGIVKVWLTGGSIEQPIFKSWQADEFHYESLANNGIAAINSVILER